MTRPQKLAAIVAGAAVLAVPLVVASALHGRTEASSPRPAAAAGAAHVADLLTGIPQRGPALGSPTAPVTLVEFADLQCPYCGAWAREALPGVIARYVRPGKVRIVFAGLAFVGPDSERALRAAVAAGERDRLWNVVELLYENQGAENSGWVSDDLLRSVAASVPGLEASRLVEPGVAVADAIAATAREAQTAGVDSTPTFFAGRAGAPLQRLDVRTLDVNGISPALDALLAE